MSHYSWEDESRSSWGTKAGKIGDDAQFSLDKIQVGCLQRVAAALEKIETTLERLADCLDPRMRMAVLQQADKQRREEASRSLRAQWLDSCFTLAREALEEKLRLLFTATELRRTLLYKLVKHWDWWPRRKTPEVWLTREQLMAAVEAFDPLTFDWTRVELGPKTRARVQAVVAARVR